jgi:phenylpropionate dioxygenase-like ring-hydroxylating dioxygenase large terminal subunit
LTDAKEMTEGAALETRSEAGKPYPAHLAEERPPYRPGVARVAVDRFFKQEYHDLEVERIWKKVWQYACREDEIPEVGDYIVYEIATASYIVVRTAEKEFKAFPNACLHRGRQLCDHDGKRAEQFQCQFHGWAWDIRGKMTNMTCGWDFPGVTDEVKHLPECKTGTWGGFVFINPDPDAEPLADFLGTLPDHFENAGHDYAKRWKQVHVTSYLDANWKVVAEAFLEAWHVTFTHPQIVRAPNSSAVRGIRWDDFGNFMRAAAALPTDKYKTPGAWGVAAEIDQQVVDQHFDWHMDDPNRILLQPGETSGEFIMRAQREGIAKALGPQIEDYHDVHLFAGEMYNVFPNLHPWNGFSRLCYRFRPYKDDPNRSIMDVMLMAPWPDDKPMPPPATPQVIDFGEPILEAKELGQLARIFSQDLANIPYVQTGLKSSQTGYVLLSSLNDAPVRHFHDLYDKWMGFEDGDYLAKWQPSE